MRRYISLYTFIGLLGLIAVFVGFAKTFLLPVANGTFQAPSIIYIHGAFTFGWVALFFVQAALIKAENWRLHMILGSLGIIIALGTAFTIPFAGAYQVEKDLANGLGDTAISTILGTVTAAIIYLCLVAAGLIKRRVPDVHKRLMLLATIAVLWPAWFRFRHYFPSVPNPEIWFAFVLADSLILISWIWDKRENGRVHPVLLCIGSLLIAEHAFEIAAFDSGPWRIVAKHIYSQF